MKIIKKSNVKNNAIQIPSEAARELNIQMYTFIRKEINSLSEKVVCVFQFQNDKGEIMQSEDIILKDNIANIDKYDARLKQNINGTTCLKDLKKFIKNNLCNIPKRIYYDEGYGWAKDGATGNVRFDGASIEGIGEIVLDDQEHHLTKKGDIAKTIEICNEVMKLRIKTQFLIAASLAAPIFSALDSKSLIINVNGMSSQGKTTILNLCMSFWSELEDKNITSTWNNTENAICSRLNNIEGVPFLLDDTSQGATKNFTDIIYNIEGGKSKGRLNKLFKVDNVAEWHTCIFSASEESMYEKTDQEKKGLLRRLVEMNVEPGDLIEDEKQVRKINKVIKENYGKVGVKFVKKLFENNMTDSEFKKINELLEEEKNSLQNNNYFDGISKGLAEKMACIILAAKLGDEYFGLEFDINSLLEYIHILISETSIKVNQTIIVKKDFKTCYKEVCAFAEEKLDDNYKTEFTYLIPVAYFNMISSRLGYEKKELRVLFMENGICDFSKASEIALENSAKIYDPKIGKGKTQKVIAVTKMI